jgi:hypothetical protein
MPKNYFGERVAERYDESAADMFEPAQVDPLVDFLAELATDGLSSSGSAPAGSPYRWRNAASAYTASICRRPWLPSCG